VPALIERIADDRWGSVGDPVNTDNSTGNTSKDAALKALRQLAPEKVEEALVRATSSKNAKTRTWATSQLATVGTGAAAQGKQAARSESAGGVSPAVQALIAQLKDKDADVRHAAAESLAKMKAKDAVPALIERVADDLWGSVGDPVNLDNSTGNTSKDAALKSLKQLAPDKVEAALVQAMKSKNPKVKTWATGQLGNQ
jgi:HEAT repeat protein